MKKLKRLFLGFQLFPPPRDCSLPPRCPSNSTKLHVGFAACSLGTEAKRKECQPLVGLAPAQGRGPTVGPVSCPLQASTTLLWQECGCREAAGSSLPSLEAQGLSPGPLQSAAEATPGQPQGAGLGAPPHFSHPHSFKVSCLQ